MQGMTPSTPAPSHIAQAATPISTCARTGTIKYAVPTVILSSQTTAPVHWRPLAYLQKASSAPRSLLRVQRDPMSHLPGVGLARCLSGNL